MWFRSVIKKPLFYFMVQLFVLVGITINADAYSVSSRLDSTVVENFYIHYKCDSVDVNPAYLDNPTQLPKILNFVSNSPRIDSIIINAYASPEGRYNYNKELSIERAETAKRLLLSYSNDTLRLNPSKIIIRPCAENWGAKYFCIK